MNIDLGWARLPERFRKNIRISEQDCWVWTAGKNANGYGRFMFNGKATRTHRFSYENFAGRIPPGLQIDHLCRNRACCNPSHLEPVSATINNRRSAATKLNADDVREIRFLAEMKISDVCIAEYMGIARNTVCDIRLGRSWCDILEAA